MTRSGICDGGQIHGWDWSAEADVWHIAERTSLILVNREILVEKLDLPQYLHLPHCGSRIDWQCVPLRKTFRLNEIHFTVNSCYFRYQIGWDHTRWVGEVNPVGCILC